MAAPAPAVNRTPFTITLPFVMVPVLTTGALVTPAEPPPPPHALRANTAATAAPTPYMYFFICFMASSPSSSSSTVSSAASDEYGIPITAVGFFCSLPSRSFFPLPPSIAVSRGFPHSGHRSAEGGATFPDDGMSRR